MTKAFAILLALTLLSALPALANSVNLSGTGADSAVVGGTGYYTFGNTGGNFGPYNYGVPESDSASAISAMGILGLPSGATITSAILTWNITAPSGTNSVGYQRSETDYQYQSGSYFVCDVYFFGCISGHYVPLYSYGYGGTGNVSLTNSVAPFSVFSVGGNTYLLSGLSGSANLLSISGMAGVLGSGGAVSFSSQLDSQLNFSVSSYGYESETYYYPTSDTSLINNSATLQITYDLPTAPVPEPASLVLFGTGLAALAEVVRRKRS